MWCFEQTSFLREESEKPGRKTQEVIDRWKDVGAQGSLKFGLQLIFLKFLLLDPVKRMNYYVSIGPSTGRQYSVFKPLCETTRINLFRYQKYTLNIRAAKKKLSFLHCPYALFHSSFQMYIQMQKEGVTSYLSTSSINNR